MSAFKTLVFRGGWCCEYGCLAVEDARARLRAEGRLTPLWFKQKFGYTDSGGRQIIRKFQRGEYKCEKSPECMFVKAGIRAEDLPSLSESLKAFLALKGQHFGVYKTQALQRIGDPIKGTIVGQSHVDWLWICIAVERVDTTIFLGDQLWLDNAMYGTVIDIDGPNLTLLLPGHHHKQRHRKVHNSKRIPHHTIRSDDD